MVATFIMAVAITGLVSNLSGSLRNASRLGAYDRAAILAKRQMDELQLNRMVPRWIPIEGGWSAQATGSVPMKWRAIITPFDVPPGAGANEVVLDRIQLRIEWENKSFTLEGFRRGYLTGPDAERIALEAGRAP
jgi:type II secretory pathway pseudopilin PulG